MKILFTSAIYSEETGGAEISTRILFENLLKRGHDVKIATLKDVRDNSRIIKIPFSKLIPDKLVIPTTAFTDKIIEIGLSRIVKIEKPDLIHIQDMSTITAGVKVAKRFNIPVICTIRDYRFISNIADFDDGRDLKPLSNKEFNDLLYKMLKRRNYPFYYFYILNFLLKNQTIKILNSIKNTNRVISISNYVKKLLIQNFIPENKINIIHIFTKPLKESKIIKKEKNIIIFSPGRLIESKGFDWLIKSFAEAYKKDKNLKLIISGEGPKKKYLQELIVSLGLEKNVQLTGKVKFDKINYYYTLADIVIVPSIWPEPLGRVSLEAFSLKKPVIASKVGGIPEIVDDNINGYLVNPGNESELTEKILKLSKNKKLREKLGLTGYNKFLTSENPKVGVKKHLDLYNKVIKDFSSPK